jgi:peptidoglycan hydrolase-like protein with peptidoglycan-binding domain
MVSSGGVDSSARLEFLEPNTPSLGTLKMKFLLTICLLLISTPPITSAQQSNKRQASLTRAQTREAERQLSGMGYWTGAVDGRFDRATRSALIAFQKWEGRPVTGRFTVDELEAIRTSSYPKARELGYEHVEVDVDRQVLLMVNDAGGVKVLPVSTGSGKRFVEEGEKTIAYTPRGRFIVYDQTAGWEKDSGRSMYYSNLHQWRRGDSRQP